MLKRREATRLLRCERESKLHLIRGSNEKSFEVDVCPMAGSTRLGKNQTKVLYVPILEAGPF
jgi:hypothetical protein